MQLEDFQSTKITYHDLFIDLFIFYFFLAAMFELNMLDMFDVALNVHKT